MLGQPASSQTVCSPSRRTSDLSSVYSGPVLSRVLIHSGLRSIGTWLLRTSRRRSLRPLGPIGEPGSVVGAAVSVMISTVPRAHDRPGTSEVVPGRRRRTDQAGFGGVVGSPELPEEASGTSSTLRFSGSPGAGCAVCMPRSLSGGVASPAAPSASETVLPESLLGVLGTGSSR